MMMTKKVWLLTVIAVGGTMSAVIAVANTFVPGVQDVADPLGRPSVLALQVIHSSSEFDRISKGLVPKHADLRERIGVLNGVADDLDALVGAAGNLTGLTASADAGTAQVGSIAEPLPGLIGNVTNRSQQAVGTVDELHGSVGSVAGQLDEIVLQEQAIYGDLQQLGPRAQNIAAVLSNIEQDSAHLKLAGPVLRVLSGTQ